MRIWQIVECTRCGLRWDEEDRESEVCPCILLHGNRIVRVVSQGATNLDSYELAADL